MSNEQDQHDTDWRTSGEQLWDAAQSLNLAFIRRSSINGPVLSFELTGFIDASDVGDLQEFAERMMREFWSRQLDHFTGDDEQPGEEWKGGAA